MRFAAWDGVLSQFFHVLAVRQACTCKHLVPYTVGAAAGANASKGFSVESGQGVLSS